MCCRMVHVSVDCPGQSSSTFWPGEVEHSTKRTTKLPVKTIPSYSVYVREPMESKKLVLLRCPSFSTRPWTRRVTSLGIHKTRTHTHIYIYVCADTFSAMQADNYCIKSGWLEFIPLHMSKIGLGRASTTRKKIVFKPKILSWLIYWTVSVWRMKITFTKKKVIRKF